MEKKRGERKISVKRAEKGGPAKDTKRNSHYNRRRIKSRTLCGSQKREFWKEMIKSLDAPKRLSKIKTNNWQLGHHV